MQKIVVILIFMISIFGYTQNEEQRINDIKTKLELLSVSTPSLTENIKTDIQVQDITLANFLLAISELHKVNINVSTDLNQPIKNNFTNATVSDLLVFLCKEYDLTIDFTGNILSIKRYQKPEEKPEERIIPIAFNPSSNSISIDAKGDALYDVFKIIMNKTGKNLVFSPALGSLPLTAYIQDMPFESAMNNLAFANNLYVEKSKEGFYLFEGGTTQSPAGADGTQTAERPVRRRQSNFFFKVLNEKDKLLEVDFQNTPIADVINDIGNELKIDVFTATPLDAAGAASFKAKSISFDNLLTKLFEAQTNASSNVTRGGVSGQNSSQNQQSQNRNNVTGGSKKFTYKKEGNIYYFGTEGQLSVRNVEVVALQFRSVELLADPSGAGNRRPNNSLNSSSNGTFNNFNNGFGSNFNQNNGINNNSGSFNNRNNQRQGLGNQNSGSFGSGARSSDLLSIIPKELTQDLDIEIDFELNSFYITGPSSKIERFKAFIKHIDKPVPVVLIEVMIIEVSRNNTIETGVEWGLGDNEVTTKGNIYPNTDLTFGAKTINKIIGSFDDFGGFNLGKVVPNFFARVKAMESNGNFKVLSTPKLATLNGHRATFSNGETSYYAVTQRNIIGTDNPQSSEITNYFPIDAELGLTIKPSVSGNGQVLLDINVIQSSFGDRISEEAPPDISSRNFTSIIRMQDQDIAILGGLEENLKSNSGSGVPFLARIPIIKYLFSKRRREAKKSKLSVLIKPTVIY